MSQRQTSSDPGSAEPDSALSQSVSPLLPGLTDDFEANPAGILARFPTANGKPEAKVVLPSHANAAFELQAIGSGMHERPFGQSTDSTREPIMPTARVLGQ